MRKRKSPIVLVTVLAIMASVAFGFNYASNRPGGNPAGEPPAPPASEGAEKTLGEARAPEDASSVSKSIGASMSSAKRKEADPATPHEGPPGMSGPMIMNHSRPMGKQPKPKPNSSSTSAQWYDKESALGADKD